MSLSLRRYTRMPLVVALTAATALAGCDEASTLSSPNLAVASRANDPCASSIAPFKKLRRERNERIAGYAALAAAASAAIAKSAGADSKTTLIAAVVGGLGGAALGYYHDKQKRTSSTQSLRNAIQRDAAGTVNSSDRLIRSLQQLNACRVGEVRTVVAQQRAGKITQSQAKAQLRMIEASAKADNRIINAVVGDITGDQRLYVNALGRSGDTRAKGATTAAASYKPRVSNPQKTSGGKSISSKPISVSRSRPSSSVNNIGYAAKELEAGGEAHVAAVEDAISVANELLI